MKRFFMFILVIIFSEIKAEEGLDFSKVDIEQLATHVYGTDLLFLENSHYTEHKSYKFEDFFWTGSGDGSTDDNVWISDSPGVVYKTSTVVSTVYVDTPKTTNNQTTSNSNCTFDCESPGGHVDNINPTPTLDKESRVDPGDDDDGLDAGRQFWLVTVLKSDGKDPTLIDLKNSLAKLYKVAFQRQQDQHLGFASNRKKRTPTEKPVNVYIHKVDKEKLNGDDKIEVLYHVEVLGKPVDAYTAANDMRLVTDDEVRSELGYPLLVKAEPYLKPGEPMGLSKARNTWFVIGVSIMGVLVILLVLAFLILGCTKRKATSPSASTLGIENKRHIFERGASHENKGLVQDEDTPGQERCEGTPTYINFEKPSNVAGTISVRPGSSASVTSSSSSSLDISPLMSLSKKRKTPRKVSRPRAAMNKTVPLNAAIRRLPPEVFDSDSSTSRKEESPDFAHNFDPGVISPKSYLSMPSVKSFPRTSMPEPLTKVLEPVSVTHLDMPSGESPDSPDLYQSGYLTRHGSVGTVEDPGIVGPAVWNMHYERLRHGVSVDQGINDLRQDYKATGNIAKMRKRFHDLLDDTFSLFGSSRKGSPVNSPIDDRSRPIAIDVKSHSASDNSNFRLGEGPESSTVRGRPKTTGAKTPDPYSSGPSCAWSSTVPTPLTRPVSAAPKLSSAASSRPPTAPRGSSALQRTPGGVPPRINVDQVLTEGRLRPSDPAISVIEAIKTEIERVSLPGSTTNLNQ